MITAKLVPNSQSQLKGMGFEVVPKLDQFNVKMYVEKLRFSVKMIGYVDFETNDRRCYRQIPKQRGDKNIVYMGSKTIRENHNYSLICMEFKNLESNIANSLSTISKEEFLRKINNPRHYDTGSQITRENFVSWFIRGFAVSRGDPVVQNAFIRWTSSQSGFDYVSAFGNFLASNPAESLSEEEDALFQKAFSSVKEHSDPIHELYLPVETAPTLEGYAKTFIAGDYDEDLRKDFPNMDIHELSYAELMVWADKRYQVSLERRKHLN